MLAKRRRSALRVPLALLGLLVLAVVATTGSVKQATKPRARVRHVADTTIVSAAVHDRSASLRGAAPQPAVAPVDHELLEEGLSEGNERENPSAAPQPGIPDAGSVEQTEPGKRAAIPAAISFDNGLNGGSTSDNNIAAGPDSIVVMRNSQFKVMSKTGETLLGPLNNNSIFAGTNEVQQVALSDGATYRLNYGGAESVPITRGQNNTQAGIQAALQGGNEQQQIALTNFTSYALKYGDKTSVAFEKGVNHTATAILTALNGISEVQTVAPTADSHRLTYAGQSSTPIVKGANDTSAGIQNALQGGNEVQTIAFANFNSATPGNTFRLRIGGKMTGPLGFATALGDATPVTNQNVSDEINAIFGFAGTVTVTGASATTGPVVTFAGANARKDVAPIEVVFGDCANATTPCAATNRESAKGGEGISNWPANVTATASTPAADGSYTLTFTGGLDIPALTSDNGAITETTKGAPGLLPPGTVATVGTVADTGYTLTLAGAAAKTDLDALQIVGGTGTVRELVKGTPGVSNWLSDTTVAIGTVADTGYTVTFNALTPLGSARQTGLGDVPQLVLTGTAGTVTTTTQGKPGIGQGACTNSGDGHIRYDQLAKRWLFTTPSFTRVGGLYAMCHAVSVGSDPTGPFNRYVFRRSLFPDYPRVAVWPDAYYNATSTGDNVIEKHACAVDRTRMLAGLDATEQCIIVPAVSFMEPADLDGYGVPPAGAPEPYFAAGGYQLRSIFEDDKIYTYQFHVDFDDPSKTTFTGPVDVPVAPYHFLCDGQLTQCVPQPGSTTRLDSQGDKIMHRVVYRNRNGVESIAMLHSINTTAGAGAERWYEMRLDGARQPYLYQQSTYAPDNHYRWLGSPGIDRDGDIALAFSYGGGPYLLPIATALAAASTVGQTNLKVAGVTGANINFAPGRKVNIGTGATLETATVQAVGTAGATGTGITLEAPLTLPHANASTVSNAAFMCTPPQCVAVGQRFTARQPGDPLNQMGYADGVIVDGISAAGGSRWEDWSNLAMDPTDDCTFWYYGGYGDASRTGGPFFGRTGAFRVPTCRLDATPAADASITGHFEGALASFTDSDLTAAATTFTADVDWGDGTHTLGTVTGAGGTFAITGAHDYAQKGRYTVKTAITGTDGSIADSTFALANLSTTAPGTVGGTVPATLALSLGAPAQFGAFTPGVAREYTASTTANVVSTAGDATLSVSSPGHLSNGAFELPQLLRVEITPSSFTGPVSNAAVAILFKQAIGATDALRTGPYTRTLTFTLSTTTP